MSVSPISNNISAREQQQHLQEQVLQQQFLQQQLLQQTLAIPAVESTQPRNTATSPSSTVASVYVQPPVGLPVLPTPDPIVGNETSSNSLNSSLNQRTAGVQSFLLTLPPGINPAADAAPQSIPLPSNHPNRTLLTI
jgi:hypothetical protein